MNFLNVLSLHYFSILLASYGIIYLVGKIFSSFFISSAGPATESFFKLFFGIYFFTTIYAVIITKGNSVLLFLLFFSIILILYKTYFLKRSISLISNGIKFSTKIKFLEQFIILFFIFALQLYSIYDFESSNFFLPSNPDRLLFSDITEFMNYAAVETDKINYLALAQHNPSPYHYFELWFTALLSFATKLNIVFLDHLVAAPIFGTIIYMGVRAISEYFDIRFLYSVVIAFILSVLNFQIQLPFLDHFELLKSTDVSFQLTAIEYAKFFPIYIFLITSIIFFLNKKFTLSFLAFSILPIINILLLPSYLLFTALVLPFVMYKNYISRMDFLFMSLILFFILVFLASFYLLFNANPGAASGLNSFDLFNEIIINAMSITSINIVIGSIIQVVYLTLPVILILIFFFNKFLYYFQANQLILPIVFLLALFSLLGLFTWALLHFHQESHQFYIRHAHVTINLLFVLTLFILFHLSQSKAWGIILLIFVLKSNYLYSEIKTYRNLSQLTYSSEFIKEISSELDSNDAYGAFIRDQQSLLTQRGKASKLRIGYFTHLLNNNFYLFGINDFTFTKSDRALIKYIEEGMLKEHPFEIFINNQKLHGSFESIADSQYKFIKKNKISFLVLAKGVPIPDGIIPFVTKSFTDRYSEETVVFFSELN